MRFKLLCAALLLSCVLPQAQAAYTPLTITEGQATFTAEFPVPLRQVDKASQQVIWGGLALKDKDQILTTEDMRWRPDWATFTSQVPLTASNKEVMQTPNFYMWDKDVIISVSCQPDSFCRMETVPLSLGETLPVYNSGVLMRTLPAGGFLLYPKDSSYPVAYVGPDKLVYRLLFNEEERPEPLGRFIEGSYVDTSLFMHTPQGLYHLRDLQKRIPLCNNAIEPVIVFSNYALDACNNIWNGQGSLVVQLPAPKSGQWQPVASMPEKQMISWFGSSPITLVSADELLVLHPSQIYQAYETGQLNHNVALPYVVIAKQPEETATWRTPYALFLNDRRFFCMPEGTVIEQSGYISSIATEFTSESDVTIAFDTVFNEKGEKLCMGHRLKQLQWDMNHLEPDDYVEPDWVTFQPLHSSLTVGIDKKGLWYHGMYITDGLQADTVYPLSDRVLGDTGDEWNLFPMGLLQMVNPESRNSFDDAYAQLPPVIVSPGIFAYDGVLYRTTLYGGGLHGAGLVLHDAQGRRVYAREVQLDSAHYNLPVKVRESLATSILEQILRGSKGEMRLMAPLTRAEGMVLIDRVSSKLLHGQSGCETSILEQFHDAERSAWYAQPACRLLRAGIVKGNPDGTLTPHAPLRAAEFLAMAARTLGVDVGTNGVHPWYAPYMAWLQTTSTDAFWIIQPGDTATRLWAASFTGLLLQSGK